MIDYTQQQNNTKKVPLGIKGCGNYLQTNIHFFLQDCFHGLLPGPFLLSYSFFVFSFSLFFRFCAVR